jgi:hypothetical protein
MDLCHLQSNSNLNWYFMIKLHLLFVDAISAGNCVVIKPSEVASHSAVALQNLVNQTAPQTLILRLYSNNKTPTEIAELELKHNMVPFKIKRKLPNGKFEIWKLSELEK